MCQCTQFKTLYNLSYHKFELEDTGLPQQSILPKNNNNGKAQSLEKDSPHCEDGWEYLSYMEGQFLIFF